MRVPELVDRRVLGAIRFRSWASGLPIDGPLHVMPAPHASAVAVTVIPNRSGLHVIHAAAGFEGYMATFDERDLEAVAPAVAPLRLRVIDPADRFLPRDFDFDAPRALTGAEAVGQPLDVRLYPTPTGAFADGWAVVRVRVEREVAMDGDPNLHREPVPGALVCVLQGPDAAEPPDDTDEIERVVLGRGVTEWRWDSRGPRASLGEALVTVRRIPLLQWSQETHGDVLKPGQSVRFEVTFDSALRVTSPVIPLPPGQAPVPDLAALETLERPPAAGGTMTSLVADGSFSLKARGRPELTFVINPDCSSVRRL